MQNSAGRLACVELAGRLWLTLTNDFAFARKLRPTKLAIAKTLDCY